MSLQDFKLEKDVYLCSVWKLTGQWREDRKPQLEPGDTPTEERPGPEGVHLTSPLRMSPRGSMNQRRTGMCRAFSGLGSGPQLEGNQAESGSRACWKKQAAGKSSHVGVAWVLSARDPPPMLNCPPHLALSHGHWTRAWPANLLSLGLGPDTEDLAGRPGGQGQGSQFDDESI